MNILCAGAAIVIAVLALTSGGSAAPVETVLHNFSGSGLSSAGDGGHPVSRLLADTTGALYGTAPSGGLDGIGIVFKMTPPAKGQSAWTETIFNFTGGPREGGTPEAGLIADSSGTLYGTTKYSSYGPGSIFELVPPAKNKKTWKQTMLAVFENTTPGIFGNPWTALVSDAAGALYGSTEFGGGGGMIYKLTPPAKGKKKWTGSIIYIFTGGADGASPSTDMIIDAGGNLYGTAFGGGINDAGVVYRLSPPAPGQTQWTQTVLHSFTGGSFVATGDGASPTGALIMDSSGALYGTTEGGGIETENWDGVVFKLTPPALGQTEWTETIIHTFTGYGTGSSDGGTPYAGLVADATGALYGTTLYGGTFGNGIIFKLTPPAQNQTEWTETVFHSFAADGSEGTGCYASLIDVNGVLYGTTEYGGSYNDGTVFMLTQ